MRPCGPLGFVLTHGVEKATPTFAVHGWRGGYAKAWPSVKPPALAVTRQPQTISFCSYESRIFEGRHGSCGFLLVLDILVHSNIRPNDRFIQISYGCRTAINHCLGTAPTSKLWLPGFVITVSGKQALKVFVSGSVREIAPRDEQGELRDQLMFRCFLGLIGSMSRRYFYTQDLAFELRVFQVCVCLGAAWPRCF